MVVEVSTEGLSRFSLRVLRERAMLALADPVGETDAVAPLDVEQATYNLIAAEVELRRRDAMRPSLIAWHGAEVQDVLRAMLPANRESGMAKCPAHEDRAASLSWRRTRDGFIVVKCHAGCSWPEIRRALG